ncbi:MAG: hypothetical protein H0T64_08495 [Pyrinomonadaceae bacterium]|nr:hypothetical protein [Pyrinomonadaceae bacterium]
MDGRPARPCLLWRRRRTGPWRAGDSWAADDDDDDNDGHGNSSPEGDLLPLRQVVPPLSPHRRRFALPVMCGAPDRLRQQPEVYHHAGVVRRHRPPRRDVPLAEQVRLRGLYGAARQHQVEPLVRADVLERALQEERPRVARLVRVSHLPGVDEARTEQVCLAFDLKWRTLPRIQARQ